MLSNKKAFTLIELLVVVLIIGILAAVAVPQYQKAVDKSRMTQALLWAKSITEAERVYYLANGEFTKNLEELDVSFPGCTKKSNGNYTCEDGFIIKFSSVTSVYVHLPSNWLPMGTEAAIEYSLHPKSIPQRLCYSSSARFQEVCRSLGGVPYGSHAGFFVLP